MSKKQKQRLAKLEAPPPPEGPIMHIFYAATDMDAETAMALLDIHPKPEDQILCLQLLPAGLPPCYECDLEALHKKHGYP